MLILDVDAARLEGADPGDVCGTSPTGGI